MEKSQLKNVTFWIAVLIVVLTAFLMAAVYFRILRLHVLFEPFYIHHWLSVTGTLFIAFFTPAFSFLKRRYPENYNTLVNVHVFGSLISVMFISIHFTQEISRPPSSFPNLATGIVLYPVMIILVFTGFLMRYHFARSLSRSWRFLHTSVAVAFYLIIVVHVLHGLGII